MSNHILKNGSTTTRTAGGLDLTAKGGKRQGHKVPQSLWVKPNHNHNSGQKKHNVII
jgi:hypothetical protein